MSQASKLVDRLADDMMLLLLLQTGARSNQALLQISNVNRQVDICGWRAPIARVGLSSP